MPTGYTSMVAENPKLTFAQFLWSCARAFGAFANQREDDLDAPPILEEEPDSYHLKAATRHQSRIAELEAMTSEQAEVARLAEENSERESEWKRRKEKERTKRRYEAMLAQVQAWKPPTKDHEGLRKFMMDQLAESIRFDCACLRRTEPSAAKQTAETWCRAWIKSEKASLRYELEEMEKERARIADRNEWKAQLAASVPVPKKQGKKPNQ